ncbi:MAG: hypothetical protein KatS3mg038_1185 [Candidatus Kapaibacterium sp.]|nr:MAG: hypothetical protein KatS3mg038_1185 [Candidatus Kapabacteria bacterium]
MVYACLVVVLMLSSCRTADVVRHTYVRDTVVVLAPITVRDTVPTIVRDTVVIGERVRGRDTVVRVVYAPAQRRMAVMVRTDTVRVAVRDTLRIDAPAVVREVVPWWCYALGAAALLIVITRILR